MHGGIGGAESAHEVAVSDSFRGAVSVLALTLHPRLRDVIGAKIKAVFADQHLCERNVVGIVIHGCAFDDIGVESLLESAVAVFEHFGGQLAALNVSCHRIVAGILKESCQIVAENALHGLAEQTSADSAVPCAADLFTKLFLGECFCLQGILLAERENAFKIGGLVVGIVGNGIRAANEIEKHVRHSLLIFVCGQGADRVEQLFVLCDVETFVYALHIFVMQGFGIKLPFGKLFIIGQHIVALGKLLFLRHAGIEKPVRGNIEMLRYADDVFHPGGLSAGFPIGKRLLGDLKELRECLFGKLGFFSECRDQCGNRHISFLPSSNFLTCAIGARSS